MSIISSTRRRHLALAAALAAVAGIGIASRSVAQGAQSADPDDSTAASSRTSKPAEPKSGRWRISWAVDPATKTMNIRPVPTTIEHLIKFKRPADLPGLAKTPENYKMHRIAPAETTIWSVKETLIGVAAEHDGDYRLTLENAHGDQIIGVLPDPALAPQTGRFSARINAARAIILAKFHPTFDQMPVHMPIEMVGIGYFGRFNKEENPSPEGFQMHPVFSVRFPSGSSAHK